MLYTLYKTLSLNSPCLQVKSAPIMCARVKFEIIVQIWQTRHPSMHFVVSRSSIQETTNLRRAHAKANAHKAKALPLSTPR